MFYSEEKKALREEMKKFGLQEMKFKFDFNSIHNSLLVNIKINCYNIKIKIFEMNSFDVESAGSDVRLKVMDLSTA